MSDKEIFVIDDPAAQGWTDSGATAGGSPVWNWDEDTYAIGEAPIDGSQYARQDAGWSEVVIPEGGENYWSKVAVVGGNPLGTIGVNYALDAYPSARVFYADTVNERMLVFADKAEFTETIQAADFLDAEGNSIIGAGGGPWVESDLIDKVTYSGQVEVGELLVRDNSNQQEINFASSNGQLVGQPSIFTGLGGINYGSGRTSYALHLTTGDQTKPAYDLKLDNGKAIFTGEVTAGQGLVASDCSRVGCHSSGYYALGVTNSHGTEGHVLKLEQGVQSAGSNYISCRKSDGTNEKFKVTGVGDVTAAGDATFSGTVNANRLVSNAVPANSGGFVSVLGNGSDTALIPVDGSGAATDGAINLGRTHQGAGSNPIRFKNAYFSGTVNAAGFTVNGQPISGGGAFNLGSLAGAAGSVASTELMKVSNANEQRLDLKTIRDSGTDWLTTETRLQWRVDVSDHSYIGFKNGYCAVFGWGNVAYATIGTNGVVTASDFVATSDERLKENISTAPVGLIDSLKGREWEWKESGEKGSGVVAQELEQVLPHLVHEDDEGMKSVSYMGLCAYLIEELKDCRERLAVLEAKE